MSSRYVTALLTGGVLLCFCGRIPTGKTGEATIGMDDFIGGIAFLLEGEICLSSIDGSGIRPLTETDGKVEDFRFSPDLGYVAYTKVMGMVEDVGLWEEGEEAPRTETWSIVIVDLVTMRVWAEIKPDDGWLHLGKWSTGDTFIYYSSSGFDVSGYYRYDARQNMATVLDYLEGHRLLLADFSSDGQQMLYVDDTGLGENFCYRVRMRNLVTHQDRVLASRRRILNQCLSHDVESVAFVEIQSVDSQSVAIIWRYSLGRESVEELTTLPAKTRGGSLMSWSVHDRCLGLFYSPSQRANGYLFSLADPSDVHEISGKQFCWAGDDAILYSRGASDVFLYDLKDREETLLIEKATHPVYLYRAD